MRRTPFHPVRLMPRLAALAEPLAVLSLAAFLRFIQ